MTASQGISNNFIRNLFTLAAIVLGVIYIEKHITDTMKELTEPLNLKYNGHETRLTGLEQKDVLNTYKWNLYEDNIKSFLKPEEPRRKKR